MTTKEYSSDFLKALEIGRPPNISKLFPHSRALIVSGKVIDRAMISKGKAVAIKVVAKRSAKNKRSRASA